MARKRKTGGEPVPVRGSPDTTRLLTDLRTLIEAGRAHVARAVNARLVLLYWGVGERIRREILGSSVPPTARRLSRQCRDN
jgi:hypothetical protein